MFHLLACILFYLKNGVFFLLLFYQQFKYVHFWCTSNIYKVGTPSMTTNKTSEQNTEPITIEGLSWNRY